MKKISQQLVTKDQLENIYTAWGVTASVPKAKQREVVCFPNKEHAEITWSKHKSDYNQRLYLIEFFVH